MEDLFRNNDQYAYVESGCQVLCLDKLYINKTGKQAEINANLKGEKEDN